MRNFKYCKIMFEILIYIGLALFFLDAVLGKGGDL